ncbi:MULTISPECIES: hypothetical protein [unclassified Streptomyces]|uniref:hypothetical protein n=1 Tax=unclassified Streptomyces TaxID=2593676 RepID=UPI0035E10428
MQYEIDLDADRREVQYPDGINVRLRGHGFCFPAELPADALDPLLSDDLDLVGLLADLTVTSKGSAVGDAVELFFRRPSLPKNFLSAVKETYKVLLGDEPFDRFLSVRPSISDYVRLTKALASLYGVELGKSFGLDGSSTPKSDEATSKPTSPDTTSSTPEDSGSAPGSPGSSESDG